MGDNKMYYWLKLNQDFFEDDTMKWLEEQENGRDYIIFYLKLCLKSLADDGGLIRYVGKTLIPYDVKALAKLTSTPSDTVAVAMKTFEEIGLISVLDTGEIYMNQIDELIGSETDSAKRMRKLRAKNKELEYIENSKRHIVQESDSDVQKSDTEIEIEKEIELDKKKQEKRNSEKELKSRFEILWKEYPNKKGKENAFKAYKKAIKEKVTDSDILNGIRRYKQEIAFKQTEQQFIAHGSTWFNQRRWEDDYVTGRAEPRENSSLFETQKQLERMGGNF